MYEIWVVTAISVSLGGVLALVGEAIRNPEERPRFFEELQFYLSFIGLVSGLAFVFTVREWIAETRASKEESSYPMIEDALSLLETDAEHALWGISLIFVYCILKQVAKILLWVFKKSKTRSDA